MQFAVTDVLGTLAPARDDRPRRSATTGSPGRVNVWLGLLVAAAGGTACVVLLNQGSTTPFRAAAAHAVTM